ncbi:MAG: co-chaperone GroES [Chlamydiales bacterium]|nr:co-chaperone GroES [Chlamydiales bacterium]
MSQEMKKKLSLRPLGDRLIVQRLEQEETLKGGIILPDTAKKKQEMATVVAIGNGKVTEEGKTLPMPVKVGDTILMDKYSGQEVTVDSEEYLVLRADDVIATVEK